MFIKNKFARVSVCTFLLTFISLILSSTFLNAGESDCDFCPGDPISIIRTDRLDWFGIQRVVFNTIDNGPTTVEQAYQDFTHLSTEVNAGSSYKLYVFVDNYGGWKSYIRAWFDWNQDCDFDDPEELWDIGLDQLNFNPPDPYCDYDTIRVFVPAGAASGSTLMRVRTEAETFDPPEPCGTVNYGEAEDYSINVIGGVSCQEQPQKPPKLITLDNYPNPFNSSTTFTFTLKEPTNISLKIYSLDGKLVYNVLADINSAPGIHKVEYRPDKEIRSSLFLVKLETEKQIVNRKFIYLK